MKALACVFITPGPITNLFACGEGDSGGHEIRETKRRGLCGLVCPPRTSERGEEGDCVECGGEGDCVKEGGGEEGEHNTECAPELLLCHSPRH